MTRAGLSMLALMLLGCHPPAPAPAAAPEQPEPTVQPDIEPAPTIDEPDTPTEPPAPVVSERVIVPDVIPPGIAPPGVDASQTACEQSCAEVHDCTLLDPKYTPASAAAIELGCLGACVHAPADTATLFGCTRPTAIEPPTCTPFLGCLGPAWPQRETETPTVVELTSGCQRTCEQYALCVNPSVDVRLIIECVDGCQRLLTPEQERRFGACADLPDCEQLIACVLSTPGA